VLAIEVILHPTMNGSSTNLLRERHRGAPQPDCRRESVRSLGRCAPSGWRPRPSTRH